MWKVLVTKSGQQYFHISFWATERHLLRRDLLPLRRNISVLVTMRGTWPVCQEFRKSIKLAKAASMRHGSLPPDARACRMVGNFLFGRKKHRCQAIKGSRFAGSDRHPFSTLPGEWAQRRYWLHEKVESSHRQWHPQLVRRRRVGTSTRTGSRDDSLVMLRSVSHKEWNKSDTPRTVCWCVERITSSPRRMIWSLTPVSVVPWSSLPNLLLLELIYMYVVIDFISHICIFICTYTYVNVNV